jgi:sugar fermentation stimulation protein A
MHFSENLIPATLIRRYKRFLADVELGDGSITTVHVANPGGMTGLQTPGTRVWLSRSANLKRKLPLSWELIEADFGDGPELVGVNTGHPNTIVAEALAAKAIPELAAYPIIRREVKYGTASRVDFLLEAADRPACYVEVKNVHMMRRTGLAEFPDAVTARGARHLDELAIVAKAGCRAVMLFVIQIGSASRFDLARDIDPAYGVAFDRAVKAGVEVLAYGCRLGTDGIYLAGPVKIAAKGPVDGNHT